MHGANDKMRSAVDTLRGAANTLRGAADTVCGAADMMGVAADTMHGAADMMAQWVSQDQCQTPPIWKTRPNVYRFGSNDKIDIFDRHDKKR